MNWFNLLISCIQWFAFVLCMFGAVIAFGVAEYRFKQEKYIRSKVLQVLGLFLVSWSCIKWSLPVDQTLMLGDILTNELIRLIAPMVFIVVCYDSYAESKEHYGQIQSKHYHGIERRHNT